MTAPEFRPFPKIPRLSRDIIVTEKVDGTNGVIYIPDVVELTTLGYPPILAGSKSRWLNVSENGGDNFGFCGWVYQHQADLAAFLGPGAHHGEWYGKGINRSYGLDHKRFALFNPKYREVAGAARVLGIPLDVVPVLYDGPFSQWSIDLALAGLHRDGSRIAPGFMDPEGVIVFHTASRHLYKKTIKGDEKPKGSSE